MTVKDRRCNLVFSQPLFEEKTICLVSH